MVNVKKNIPQEIEFASNDGVRVIRKHDWNRIKRILINVKKPSNLISNSYSILFGIATTCFFSLLTLNESNSMWVKPIFITVGSFSAFLGLILLIIDRKIWKKLDNDSSEALIEMEEIEKLYQSAETVNPSISSRQNI